MVVHLKDVLKAGAHENCAWGEGIIDIEASVAAIREIGYQGSITIEMEPYGYDPTPAIVANLKKLKQWMS
jgi:sugar phosphate isomerase/epimerase